MTEQKWNDKVRGLAHVALVLAVTVFSVMLIVLNRTMDWEVWMIPVVLAAFVICVTLHTGRFATENGRLTVYAIVLLFEYFYYSMNVRSVYDCTPVIAILLVLFAMTGSKSLIYVGVAVGVFSIATHLALMGTLDEASMPRMIYIVRTGWHFVLVLAAGIASARLLDAWEKSEEDYRAKILQVEEENKRINTFLVNVSHEVRTPVNAVVGLSSVMLKRKMDEETQKDVRSVLDAGRRVAEQIGDILDFTEIDMGRLTVSSEAYTVVSLVTDILAENPARSLNGCELIFDVDPKTPTSLIGDAAKIKKIVKHLIANALKFLQKGGVYIRLYTLKREYGANLCVEVTDTGIGMTEAELEHVCDSFYQTSSGKTRTTGGLGLGLTIVRGMVREMGGFITIESEHGVGTTVAISIPQGVADPTQCMSVEKRERLCIAGFFRFEKYEVPRVRDFYAKLIGNTARGLGLPVHLVKSVEDLELLRQAYGLTHLFVGEEEFLSAMNTLEPLADELNEVVIAGENFHTMPGSAIHILTKPFSAFPVAAALSADDSAENAEAWNETRALRTPGLEALVVDDEPMNLLVAEGVFGDYGMNVTTARSGAEAIERCREKHFDLVFMDHMMPEMDGVEAMKRIRAETNEKGTEPLFVALTANAVSGARKMFLAEGFDGFVAKPIETTELERTLKRILPKTALTYGDAATVRPAAKKKKDDGWEAQAARLERVGVHTANGLKYCRGDREFYRTILQEYANHAQEKAQDLRRFYDAKDWKNYAILVHAIKSGTQMIGAQELSDLARVLEAAAKRNDGAEIEQQHDTLLALFMAVNDAITGGRRAGPADSGEEAEKAEEEVLEFFPGEDDVMEFEPEGE